MIPMNARQQLTKARAQLVLSHPFFGTLAYRLKFTERSDFETMATDGKSLFYNPAFVESLSLTQTVAVLAHEVMHPASLHQTRRAGRDPADWNRAADYAINPILKDAGFDLPADALLDPCFSGMNADEIFKIVHTDKNDGDSGDGQAGPGTDPGRCGGVIDAPGAGPVDGQAPSPAEQAQAEQEWTVAAIQAANVAKQAGKLPAGLERLIDSIREPKINWRTILRHFMDDAAKSDYTWSPPNRRFAWMDIYLPSMYSNEMGEMVIAVDTSASINMDALELFAGELGSILDEITPRRVHVIYCDTEISHAETFERGEGFRMSAKGGGGTRFAPPFDWIADQGIDPACMIYFTDLGANDYPAPASVSYPVLWAAYNTNKSAPIGETIHLG